jgi:hypothetical protein
MGGKSFSKQEQNFCRKSTLRRPEGNRRVDRPVTRWIDSVEQDLKKRNLQIGDESHRIGTSGEHL